ncbi:hypothetical protein Mapa_007045 [Marchantia paleacea]|nr:hypothetical protein Mapa_007045 [Marchantia paleacea]
MQVSKLSCLDQDTSVTMLEFLMSIRWWAPNPEPSSLLYLDTLSPPPVSSLQSPSSVKQSINQSNDQISLLLFMLLKSNNLLRIRGYTLQKIAPFHIPPE